MDERYPIGEYEPPQQFSLAGREAAIAEIERAGALMRAAVTGLTEKQLEEPYRAGGWTVRQVVHHLPDSHLNAYVRFKLALTEDEPMVKPWEESLWAELPDAREMPIEVSLQLLESLHARWVKLLRALAPADLARTFRHPELGIEKQGNAAWIACCVRREHGYGVLPISALLPLYAWHCRHHVAHITALRARRGWA